MKVDRPKNTPYCYNNKGVCKYYKHIDGLEGYCELLKCEVTDQVKECSFK